MYVGTDLFPLLVKNLKNSVCVEEKLDKWINGPTLKFEEVEGEDGGGRVDGRDHLHLMGHMTLVQEIKIKK